MADDKVETLVKTLMSVMITANRSLSADQIANEYEAMMSSRINVRKFGFDSLEALLEKYRDSFRVASGHGIKLYAPISSEKTEGIQDLIKNQNNSSKRGKLASRSSRGSSNRSASFRPRTNSRDSYRAPNISSSRISAKDRITTTCGIPSRSVVWLNNTEKENKISIPKVSARDSNPIWSSEGSTAKSGIALQNVAKVSDAWERFKKESSIVPPSDGNTNINENQQRAYPSSNIRRAEQALNNPPQSQTSDIKPKEVPLISWGIFSTAKKLEEKEPNNSKIGANLDTSMNRLNLNTSTSNRQYSEPFDNPTTKSSTISFKKCIELDRKADFQENIKQEDESARRYNQTAQTSHSVMNNLNSMSNKFNEPESASLNPPRSDTSNFTSDEKSNSNLKNSFISTIEDAANGNINSDRPIWDFRIGSSRLQFIGNLNKNVTDKSTESKFVNFTTHHSVNPIKRPPLINYSTIEDETIVTIDTMRERFMRLIGAYNRGISDKEFCQRYFDFYNAHLNPSQYGFKNLIEMIIKSHFTFIYVEVLNEHESMLYSEAAIKKLKNSYNNPQRRISTNFSTNF